MSPPWWILPTAIPPSLPHARPAINVCAAITALPLEMLASFAAAVMTVLLHAGTTVAACLPSELAGSCILWHGSCRETNFSLRAQFKTGVPAPGYKAG